MLTQKMESYIFKLAKKGNRKAFGDLIDMYKDSAFTLVHQLMNDPIEAEKIVIRTFLLLHNQLINLPVEAKPSTIIYQFCIKLCMEKIRRKIGKGARKSTSISRNNLEYRYAGLKIKAGPFHKWNANNP